MVGLKRIVVGHSEVVVDTFGVIDFEVYDLAAWDCWQTIGDDIAGVLLSDTQMKQA